MNLIRTAIDRPVAVIAAVLLVILFGLIALQLIPIQLTPDVNRPVITVLTQWPGAAPAEVEREILNRQEEQFSGLEGLVKITGNAQPGNSSINLEFEIGTQMDKALLLVSNRLDRVTGYPAEASQPNFFASGGSEETPIAWFIINPAEGSNRPIHESRGFIEDIITDRIERVPGVARANIFGGSDREIEITVKPELLAPYGLTVTAVVTALRAANASVTAGDVEEGKRRYVVRSEGKLDSVETIKKVVIRSWNDPATNRVARVTLADIAEVTYGYKERESIIRMLSKPSVVFNVQREVGANVIETMAGIRKTVEDLKAYTIPNAGLTLTQVYDETKYINSAVDLVQQNIWVGGSLAAIILLLFLRSVRATLVISASIPVSVIGAFVAMAVLGRSINVVSLAGLAFAVGMVVDAAIVVLENIFRLREEGIPIHRAAYEGTKQVWGAVLVSALTTVMVFIPILVLELEVGQLFRDIAVAISVSVLLSLIVSITVIPALSNHLFRQSSDSKVETKRLQVLDRFTGKIVKATTTFVSIVIKSKSLSIALVSGMTAAAIGAAILFLPKLEYLPEGNRNLVFGIIIPPPGYNLDTMAEIAQTVENAIKPHWATETGADSAEGEPVKIDKFFFVATRSRTFVGAMSVDEQRAGEMIPVLQEPIFREPGTFGFMSQPSIFGGGLGGGRRIDLDIAGPDLETILEVAVQMTQKISEVMPREEGNQLRPNPGLELGAPEIRVYPDRMKLADNGLTVREFGDTIDAFNDGLRVLEITNKGERIDLMLQGPRGRVTETQGIENLPIVTSSGKIIPVSSLADVVVTTGPTEIRHRERQTTITMEIRPAPGVPLETALDTLRTKVIEPMEQAGLPDGVKFNLSGTADQLAITWEVMKVLLGLALIIVYLVMAVLFESFVYPLIILLSVPVAACGGVGGLAILNLFTFQALDMLTLLGFVILIGIVVNNAILLVHQTLYGLRELGLGTSDAILEATRNRIRPIFMSTLTSVFGMLPLVLFPGAGSELYRGLGSVVVGGLSLSAILTLIMIPPLMAVLMPNHLSKEQQQGLPQNTATVN